MSFCPVLLTAPALALAFLVFLELVRELKQSARNLEFFFSYLYTFASLGSNSDITSQFCVLFFFFWMFLFRILSVLLLHRCSSYCILQFSNRRYFVFALLVFCFPFIKCNFNKVFSPLYLEQSLACQGHLTFVLDK